MSHPHQVDLSLKEGLDFAGDGWPWKKTWVPALVIKALAPIHHRWVMWRRGPLPVDVVNQFFSPPIARSAAPTCSECGETIGKCDHGMQR